MKKNYVIPLITFLCGVVIALGLNKIISPSIPTPLSSGIIYYPDDSLDNYAWRVFKNSYGHFVVPYNAARIQVTTVGSVVTLTDSGQSCSYTGTGATIKYDAGNHSAFLQSTNAIGPDTIRSVTSVGPFDPVGGYFYCTNGRLHYVNSVAYDSTICPVSRFIWMGQGGTGGQGIAIGFVTQTDITQ